MEHNIALISSPILVNDLHISPPTFSRLPPDGHEFPPNFSEPLIITPVLKQNGSSTNSINNSNNGLSNNVKLAKDDKIRWVQIHVKLLLFVIVYLYNNYIAKKKTVMR